MFLLIFTYLLSFRTNVTKNIKHTIRKPNISHLHTASFNTFNYVKVAKVGHGPKLKTPLKLNVNVLTLIV